MEREQDLQTKQVTHLATVMKDRANLIDGKQFPDPGFAQFFPHVQSLAIGKEHKGIDTNRTSEDSIPSEKHSRDHVGIQREIALDEIEALLVERYPSQSASDKQAKASLVKQFFGTTSWTEIEKLMKLDELRYNFDRLYRHLNNNEPSRYTAAPVIVQQTPVEEDGIPEFGGEQAQAVETPTETEGAAGEKLNFPVWPVKEDAPEPASIIEQAVAQFGQEKVLRLSEDMKSRYTKLAADPARLKEALETRLSSMLAAAKKEAEPEPEPAKGKAAEALPEKKRVRVQAGQARVDQAGRPSPSASARSDATMALDLAFAGLRGVTQPKHA
jgi:hypothetical protein